MELWRDPRPGDAGLAAFREVYADPVLVNGVPTAVEVLADRAWMMQSAVGGLTHHLHDQFAAPGRRAFAFRVTGRHIGPLATPLGVIAATGRAFDVAGVDIFEVDETVGRVTGIWAVADYLGMLAALEAVVPAGALSPPAPAPAAAANDGEPAPATDHDAEILTGTAADTAGLALATDDDAADTHVAAGADAAEILVATTTDTAHGLVPTTTHTTDIHVATGADAAEILVLQRCCWVAEALANDTLEIPALHESLQDVRDWLDSWSVWCVRMNGRLVGAVRAHRAGTSWEIGRLMVAPDLAGRGLGRQLLAHAEAVAPPDVATIELFTGAHSERNISIYERAGFHRTNALAPPGAINLAKPVKRS